MESFLSRINKITNKNNLENNNPLKKESVLQSMPERIEKDLDMSPSSQSSEMIDDYTEQKYKESQRSRFAKNRISFQSLVKDFLNSFFGEQIAHYHSKNLKETESLYHREELEEIESLIESLTRQLGPQFIEGTYPIMIGEDSSGRIPALALSGVAQKINPSEKISTFFLAGSRFLEGEAKDIKKQLIKDYLVKLELDKKLLPKQKVLLVTDMIDTGKSMIPLSEALHEMSIPFDIATCKLFDHDELDPENILTEKEREYFDNFSKKTYEGTWEEGVYGPFKYSDRYSIDTEKVFGTNVFAGSISSDPLKLYYIGSKKSSGVVKDPKEVLSQRSPDYSGPIVREAREDTKTIIETVTKNYFKKNNLL